MPQTDTTTPSTSLAGAENANQSLNALSLLHCLSEDTRRGFEKMAAKAEAGFQPTAERFAALHARHTARLDRMVREMGGLPDTDGSFMGTLNVAVVTLRALFDAIDTGAMDRVRSGEDNVLDAFDTAIAASLPQGHNEALLQMRAELTDLLDATRHLG